MRISLFFEIELGRKKAAFKRSIGVVTAPVNPVLPHDEILAQALKETPDAVKALARCNNAREAYTHWRVNGQPALPCSPEELFWRTKPLHQRPGDWQDDPI